MNLDSAKKRISAYLCSDKRWPVIVDFSARKNLSDFIEHFQVGENKILSAEHFCREDGDFKVEEFINAIGNNEGTIFVVGITAYLKLHGDSFAKNTLKSVLSKSTNGHIVVVTYQCSSYLNFADSRFYERNQVVVVDGESDTASRVYLISPALHDAFPGSYSGLGKLGEAFESSENETIYVATEVSKTTFDRSVLNITQMNDSYDILCSKDSRTKNIPSNYGTAAQWGSALKMMGLNGDWFSIVEQKYGSINGLSDCISQYGSFDSNEKWLYFIVLSIFGSKKNAYLQKAVFNAASYGELVHSLFRTLLTVNPDDAEFEGLYKERKDILKHFSDAFGEIVDYCKVISVKEEKAIYYLTDLSVPEKERIIDWLDCYGSNYNTGTLCLILRSIFPELADYLSTYRFKNKLLNSYFESYKYQKVINKILPSFETVVDEQSRKLEFVDILPSRSSIVDKLNLTNSHAYFFDALGVEYLGYIQAKCNQYGLSANIVCCRCELPSLTCFNKEFVAVCEAQECPVSDIKALDEIKHHGEENFDYEKVKSPVYLIQELELIDELLRKIRANIFGGSYSKAVVISDHGASRLAVLHETENLWKMATSGIHSGRCCPKNEVDEKPDFAIEAENFWVLANYDRFQGGRKANVEVHGGASLEEVAVPVIEIAMKPSNVEAFITDESKVITLAAKEHPVIKLYVGINSNSITVRMGNNFYDANKLAEYLYEVEIPDCTKKGIYYLDILDGTDTLATNEKFEVKKKGMAEVSLFD